VSIIVISHLRGEIMPGGDTVPMYFGYKRRRKKGPVNYKKYKIGTKTHLDYRLRLGYFFTTLLWFSSKTFHCFFQKRFLLLYIYTSIPHGRFPDTQPLFHILTIYPNTSERSFTRFRHNYSSHYRVYTHVRIFDSGHAIFYYTKTIK